MGKNPVIWALIDPRPGTGNQVLGVAESLGLPYEKKPLRYSIFANLSNELLQVLDVFPNVFSCAVDAETRAGFLPPWPDVIIASGRRAGYVAWRVKKLSGNKTKLVQLMHPRWQVDDFDLIFTPEHDGVYAYKQGRDHIFYTVGSPHHVTPAKLAAARNKWQEAFVALPKPHIALLLGGPDKSGHGLTLDRGIECLETFNKIALEMGGSLLITPSRRTPQNLVDRIPSLATAPAHIHGGAGDNPYLGYLACADYIVATGDSTSMLCEAASAGKPLFIYAPPGLSSPKHLQLHERLLVHGGAKIFSRRLHNIEFNPEPLDTARDIAGRIKEKLLPAA